MRNGQQIVWIAAYDTTFSAKCDRCAGDGYPAVFAGRLDLDLEAGVFLCRHGHHVRVVRILQETQGEVTAAA